MLIYIIQIPTQMSKKMSKNEQNFDNKPQYSVYNRENILITKTEIYKILKKAGVNNRLDLDNLGVFQRAFVHSSYSINGNKKERDKRRQHNDDSSDDEYEEKCPDGCVDLQPESLEVGEWLGDGILQSIVTDYLYHRFPNESEGFLTKTRSKLVNTKSLAVLSNFLGMPKYILMSTHVEKVANGRTNSRILEDCFESFIGAIYLHFSKKKDKSYAFSVCYDFVTNSIESAIDIVELIKTNENYKDILMRYYQKNFNGSFPIYKLSHTKTDENDNRTIFYVYVTDPKGKIVGNGYAKSKKQAQQYSAKDALKYFKYTGK